MSTAVRSINQATLDLVRSFEGLYLEAYQCPAGVWTIGYGHTGICHNDGTVKQGRVLRDETEALELLNLDLRFFAAGVDRLLLPRPREQLNDNMFGALVSFSFNVGLGNLEKSSMLRKINARDYSGAIGEFEKWNRADGKVLRGLTRRRLSERNLWCSFPNPVVPA